MTAHDKAVEYLNAQVRIHCPRTKVEDLTDAELDVLVAEKVKGWTLVRCTSGGNVVVGFDEDTRRSCLICPPEGWSGDDAWRPSTDIACAFQVDKPEWEWFFGEKGDDLHANVYVASEESGVYTVVVPLDPANKTAAYCRGRCIAACYACGITEV